MRKKCAKKTRSVSNQVITTTQAMIGGWCHCKGVVVVIIVVINVDVDVVIVVDGTSSIGSRLCHLTNRDGIASAARPLPRFTIVMHNERYSKIVDELPLFPSAASFALIILLLSRPWLCAKAIYTTKIRVARTTMTVCIGHFLWRLVAAVAVWAPTSPTTRRRRSLNFSTVPDHLRVIANPLLSLMTIGSSIVSRQLFLGGGTTEAMEIGWQMFLPLLVCTTFKLYCMLLHCDVFSTIVSLESVHFPRPS